MLLFLGSHFAAPQASVSTPHSSFSPILLATKKAPPKPVFRWCPETGEKILITTVTLTEIKKAQKTGDVPKAKKKQLVRIPSKQIREKCYEDAARAIESKEQQIMPTYGGRPWQVFCRFTEPNTTQKPPLFRWFRGKLELAVLPHFLAKVPEPMETRGMAKLEEESEEGFYNASTDLCERTESQISRIAWNDREHQIPIMTLKWLSPNHERFSSRKSAEEEALKLMEQQLLVDKIVFGYGARGQKLHPRKPTKADALKAGKWRFLRDGLWVVGQEESWQNDRAIEIERETKRRKIEDEQKVTIVKSRPAPSIPKTALQLFVKTQRHRFREVARETTGALLDMPPFTLADAARELREVWKNEMTSAEKQAWKELLEGKEPNWSPKDGSNESNEPLLVKSDNASDVKGLNVGEKKQTVVGASRPTVQTAVTIMSVGAQSRTQSEISGIDLYTRENRDALVRRKVACNAQDSVMHAVNELSVTGSNLYTLAHADEDLQQMWLQLSSADKKEWEEKAANERNRLNNVAVVSPGDSEEEVEIANEPKPDANGSWGTTSEVEPQSSGTTTDFQKDMRQSGQEENNPGKPECNETHADSALVSGSNVRRSKRPKKGKRCFEDEYQLDHEKPRAVHVPSIWAIPVARVGGTNEERPEVGYDVRHAEIFSEAVKSPTRKRSDCLPKQITQSAHWRLSAKQIAMCYYATTEHFDKVMYTVKARALFAELLDGFDLLRERGRGRYDMELPAFDLPQFDFLTDFEKTPWMGVVKQILGDDVVLIHKGVFLSNPGADSQEYHQDGPHLTTQYQRPCHAINVFVPLVDLTLRNGPTEFVAGSHILNYEFFNRHNVVIPQVTAGTPIIFDYRLGHRGLANTSDFCRPIVYCTYAAAGNGKEFRDSVNFSRKRYHRLGDLIEKPLSREQRRKMRHASTQAPVVLRGNEKMDDVSDAKSNPVTSIS